VKKVVKKTLPIIAAATAYAIVGPASTVFFEGIAGCAAYCTSAAYYASAIAGGAAGGAAAGAASAAFMGGDIGKGALYGAISGMGSGALNAHYSGSGWGAERIAANSITQGGAAELTGGKFKNGALYGMTTGSARYIYNSIVRYDVTFKKGTFVAGLKNTLTKPISWLNNIGMQGLQPKGGTGLVGAYNYLTHDAWLEGGPVSTIANYIPGVNEVAGMHDVFQIFHSNWGGDTARNILNVPGMLPAAAITYGALVTDVSPTNGLKR
jgi:hypothetical protein